MTVKERFLEPNTRFIFFVCVRLLGRMLFLLKEERFVSFGFPVVRLLRLFFRNRIVLVLRQCFPSAKGGSSKPLVKEKERILFP